MHPKLAPALNFTQIKQASNEPFIDFIDKLRLAVEKQVEDIKKKRLMITSIAKANANDICKVIMSLPFEPPPMLTLMIQVCTRLVQVNNSATNSASEKQGEATGGV